MYKAKLLENIVAEGANGILKYAAIAVPIKYVSNFWRPLEMPLIYCKVQLKLKWTKYCVLATSGADNSSKDSDNTIFFVKNTKLFVLVVRLSARYNQKLSKRLNKGFERSVHQNEYKIKSQNKYTTNEFRYFFESNFVGVNRLFVLVYPNQNDDFTRFETRKYYLPKGIIKNQNVIINRKNFYDQPIDPEIKRHEEIRKN